MSLVGGYSELKFGWLCERKRALKVFAHAGETHLEAEEVAQVLQITETRATLNLNKLWAEDYLQRTLHILEPNTYYLSEKGREFLVENGLV